jgi:hypothetical protein
MTDKCLTSARLGQALHLPWNDFNTRLRSVSERQAEQLLQMERRGRHRHLWLMRLYGKWSTMREARERQELLQAVIGKE